MARATRLCGPSGTATRRSTLEACALRALLPDWTKSKSDENEEDRRINDFEGSDSSQAQAAARPRQMEQRPNQRGRERNQNQETKAAPSRQTNQSNEQERVISGAIQPSLLVGLWAPAVAAQNPHLNIEYAADEIQGAHQPQPDSHCSESSRRCVVGRRSAQSKPAYADNFACGTPTSVCLT